MQLAIAPQVRANQKISSGGFGTIYVDPRDDTKCIKIFNTPLEGDEAANLLYLTSVRSWARPSDVQVVMSRFAWPLELFGEEGLIQGYSMPLAPVSCYFDLVVVRRESRQPLQLKFLFDGPYWESAAVRSEKPNVSLQDRVEIAVDCCDSLGVLHRYGLSYGDISGNNVVARLDNPRGVFFFDVDSISSVDLRSRLPLKSPGWETPDGLGPIEIDRSRTALLIVRLLSEDLNALPGHDLSGLLGGVRGRELSDLLRVCHETGSEQHFGRLVVALRRLRSEERTRLAIVEARRSGFARRVLSETLESVAPAEVVAREAAQDFLTLEAAIENSDGKVRRRHLKEARVKYKMFTLDLLPASLESLAIRSLGDLQELIYEANFEEVGFQFNQSGLGPLEKSSWTVRALYRALLEVKPATMTGQPFPGEAILGFDWPESPVVNGAELAIVVGEREQRHSLSKPEEQKAFRQVLRVEDGGPVRVSLRFAARSPGGTVVVSPRSTRVELDIPPKPVPVKPRSDSLSRSPRPPLSQDSFDLVDPEMEARQLRQYQAARKRQQRRRVLFVGMPILLLGLVGGYWGVVRFLDDGAICDVQSIESTIEDNSGLIIREGVLNVSPGVVTTADRKIRIAASDDGLTWIPTCEVSIPELTSTVNLRDVPGSFFKVEEITTTEAVATGFVVSEKYEGFSSIPVLVRSGSSVSVVWTRPIPSPAAEIEGYNYRFGRLASPEVWERTGVVAGDRLIFFTRNFNNGITLQLQVRYQGGETGPWINVTE